MLFLRFYQIFELPIISYFNHDPDSLEIELQSSTKIFVAVLLMLILYLTSNSSFNIKCHDPFVNGHDRCFFPLAIKPCSY